MTSPLSDDGMEPYKPPTSLTLVKRAGRDAPHKCPLPPEGGDWRTWDLARCSCGRLWQASGVRFGYRVWSRPSLWTRIRLRNVG